MEVKPPGEHPTEAQVEIGKRIIANGGKWTVVRSIDDAQAALKEWRAA